MEFFNTIRPKNELVAQHIAYYYVHQLTEKTDYCSFHFFPHYRHGLTIYVDAKEDISKKFFTMNYSEQIPVEMKGQLVKLGIAFHPLGLNHFLEDQLSKVYDPIHREFNYWNETVFDRFKLVFKGISLEEKRDLLDEIFLELYNKNVDLTEIKRMLELIFKSNGTIRVSEIAEKLGITRKTVQRHFEKHLCCSPEEYKKVVKFRHGLYATKKLGMKSLTEVALYSLYYDQSDYTNRFKELTGYSPRELLTSVEQMGEEDIYWKIE